MNEPRFFHLRQLIAAQERQPPESEYHNTAILTARERQKIKEQHAAGWTEEAMMSAHAISRGMLHVVLGLRKVGRRKKTAAEGQ
jgi:hypothetical protein